MSPELYAGESRALCLAGGPVSGVNVQGPVLRAAGQGQGAGDAATEMHGRSQIPGQM